ncbi:MAG: hypothetical protein DI547_04880 [Sphingobium sp.]|nr:MAG: hypothetical protein DI547_04880 [Sphingobium sp.]
MPSILGLDLSKRSAGFALWNGEADKPVAGTWTLGSELTPAGAAFVKLHRNLHDLWTVSPFDIVIYEEPLNLGPHAGFTNKDTIFTLMGLATHVDSFCEAVGVRKYCCVNQSSWRRHFIGSMRRGTKTPDLKAFAMARCRQLGMRPEKHDAAEAIGILSYMCAMEGIIPPWEKDDVLRVPLEGRG